MLNIDYAFVTGLFNENTLISNDIGISRSIENLNNGYGLVDMRIKYSLERKLKIKYIMRKLI